MFRTLERLKLATMLFKQYEVDEFFDEMFGEDGQPRASARTLVRNIECLPFSSAIYLAFFKFGR